MIQKASLLITDICIKNNVIIDNNKEIYNFGFECILNVLLELMILLILGLSFNCIIPILIFSISFAFIKQNAGGYHANNHYKCLLLTSSIIFLGVQAFTYLPLFIVAIVHMMSILIIFYKAPIEHHNNPKTNEEYAIARKKIKLIVLILVLLFPLLLVNGVNYFISYALGGVLAASLTIIIPNKKEVEENG